MAPILPIPEIFSRVQDKIEASDFIVKSHLKFHYYYEEEWYNHGNYFDIGFCDFAMLRRRR
jgi:hypothetical protein